MGLTDFNLVFDNQSPSLWLVGCESVKIGVSLLDNFLTCVFKAHVKGIGRLGPGQMESLGVNYRGGYFSLFSLL